MASLDKSSVREEIDRLKAQFKELDAEGKLAPETRALFSSLLLIVDLILSVFLERQTRKHLRNSSLPSSQSEKDESALGTGGSKGKGKSLHNESARNRSLRETVTVASVDRCVVCGEPLGDAPCQHTERRTKIDIVFEKVVEHIDIEVKQCPNCQAMVKGRVPANFAGPRQYGDGLKAFAINLLVAQMVPLQRTQKLILSMIGECLSEATLLKFILRLHEALAAWEANAIDQLIKMPALHVDETSLRVDGKNHWIHVYASGDITVKRLHRKRGKEAIEAINIIPRYGGKAIHDCWASYLAYDHLDHGLCGSHLLRELEFIIETNGYAWAKNMKRLLQETAVKVSASEAKQLTETESANLQKRYRNILTRGEKELPALPNRPSGKRGRLAKSDAHNLWERLRKHEAAVLLFARDPHVAFTNNRAERDLRMAKVKQKVSGCFRTEQYANAYCRISSYLQTMATQGHNPLIAIQMALTGEIATPRE